MATQVESQLAASAPAPASVEEDPELALEDADWGELDFEMPDNGPSSVLFSRGGRNRLRENRGFSNDGTTPGRQMLSDGNVFSSQSRSSSTKQPRKKLNLAQLSLGLGGRAKTLRTEGIDSPMSRSFENVDESLARSASSGSARSASSGSPRVPLFSRTVNLGARLNALRSPMSAATTAGKENAQQSQQQQQKTGGGESLTISPVDKPNICVCTAPETPTVHKSDEEEPTPGDIAEGGGDITIVRD